MGANAAIELRNITKTFGKVVANKDVSLTFNRGEILSILGENGSGKSTLIKLLCGLYECREGHIYINGVDVREYSQSALYKLFGVVYQDFCRYQLKLR